MAARNATPAVQVGRGDEPLWIFGYGSLMWRPAFPHAERRPARMRGWARRFWQGSTDHRGVPGAPGRVVTLVAESGADCWGIAFRVDARQREVLAGLDHRERGGFIRHPTEVRLEPAGKPATALVYVAERDNPNFLGPASLGVVAEQVCRARGPSGTNVDYVLELARALRRIGARDPHVFALERLVRARSGVGSGDV